MSFNLHSVDTNTAIKVNKLSKCYQLYNQPSDRLKQFLWRGKRQYFSELWALRDIDLSVKRGEVVGIIGQNGSGKSTLLQLVCGTLSPTYGDLSISGRIAALLELGAGFNPEFTGRENIFMNAAIMGLTQDEIHERIDEIIDFSGISEQIDQPVKTYSSGMYVRLAFSVAINVDPDILVIDEALSVGDGVFSRKSFERIMALKKTGKTILFCSHALYQVEAICNKVLWLDKGRTVEFGDPARVIASYNHYINSVKLGTNETESPAVAPEASNTTETTNNKVSNNTNEKIPHIINARASADGIQDYQLNLESEKTNLTVAITISEPQDSKPSTIGVVINGFNGIPLTSASSLNDGVILSKNNEGQVHVELYFPNLRLLKGHYTVDVFLLCDQGIHVYEHIRSLAELVVHQTGPELGVVTLPHSWRVNPSLDQ